MEVFKQQGKLLEMPEAKKIIKNFNKLAKVLLEFEMLYHRGWLRQVREAVQSGNLENLEKHIGIMLILFRVY